MEPQITHEVGLFSRTFIESAIEDCFVGHRFTLYIPAYLDLLTLGMRDLLSEGGWDLVQRQQLFESSHCMQTQDALPVACETS